IGGRQILSGAWREPGVWNVEQLDPDPFLADCHTWGLPWQVIDAEPLQVP
ncbi:MAG: saccharopine dehydrogenase family protein, partial [Verrucomicrobiaceae bacterium]|nr:saccharopine dehydrogenase family protein [Verrucomicrobiaceae bacterium]